VNVLFISTLETLRFVNLMAIACESRMTAQILVLRTKNICMFLGQHMKNLGARVLCKQNLDLDHFMLRSSCTLNASVILCDN